LRKSLTETQPSIALDSARSLWLRAPPPHAALTVCVVVPVRNEQVDLPATLLALWSQQGFDGMPIDRNRYEVLLLANNCDDDSVLIAKSFALSHPEMALHVAEINLPAELAHIGHVRKLLMDEACARLGRVASIDGVVASTDGDTIVDRHWLAAIEAAFKRDIDAVGGRIVLDARSPIDAKTLRRQRCDAAHRLAKSQLEHALDPDMADPWPRHHQHFGASLAVKRSAYLRVGGLPNVRYLEDEALVAALRRADLKVRHCPAVRVTTSARHDGRVEVGLSWQLRQWNDHSKHGQTMLVEDPAEFAASLKARRLLRDAWRVGSKAAIKRAAVSVGNCYNIEFENLLMAARTASTFGTLWEAVEACGQRGDLPMVATRDAVKKLRMLVALYSEPHRHGVIDAAAWQIAASSKKVFHVRAPTVRSRAKVAAQHAV
jgi:hypothetical protein